MDPRWTEVDDYFTGLLAPPDPGLTAALADADAAGLAPAHVAPNQGKLLYLLAAAVTATRVLEIGTYAGYSTIWLARAVPPGGTVISLEADPAYAELARANLARAGLAGVAEVRTGPALATLPKLAVDGAGPFDLIFIDADKPSNPEYLEWALKLSRPGTLIVADNVVRDGAVADADSDDPRVRGVRRFAELVAAEPRLTGTALQTVGVKGYDGFLLALVR